MDDMEDEKLVCADSSHVLEYDGESEFCEEAEDHARWQDEMMSFAG